MVAHSIFLNGVPFMLVHLQIPLLDSYLTTPEHIQIPHLYPSQFPLPMQIASSPISSNCSYPCARTTTTMFAHEPNADSAMHARGAEAKAILFHPIYGVDNYQHLIIGVHAPYYDHSFSSASYVTTLTKPLFSCLYQT